MTPEAVATVILVCLYGLVMFVLGYKIRGGK